MKKFLKCPQCKRIEKESLVYVIGTVIELFNVGEFHFNPYYRYDGTYCIEDEEKCIEKYYDDEFTSNTEEMTCVCSRGHIFSTSINDE